VAGNTIRTSDAACAATAKTPTEEITGAPQTRPAPAKPMSAWERLHLYTKDIWSELRKELTVDPDADRQHNEDGGDQRRGRVRRPFGPGVHHDPAGQAPDHAPGRRHPPSGTGWRRPHPAPENAPSVVDDWPETPDILRRKKEITAALLKQRPYLKHDPQKLEAMVLDRIS
jgi:hypothetical protein